MPCDFETPVGDKPQYLDRRRPFDVYGQAFEAIRAPSGDFEDEGALTRLNGRYNIHRPLQRMQNSTYNESARELPDQQQT